MDAEIIASAVILILLLGCIVAVVVFAAKHPGYFLCTLALMVLIVSCARADDLRLEVSVVMDSADDRAAVDEAVSDAAYLYRTQLGIELVATYYDVSEVAGHTKPEALLEALKAYRVNDAKHRAADVTVMFTRRELTRGHEGIATIGPACSAMASAIVRLRTDGLDGEIAAHEITHTLGVPHDHAAGWLMSESLARVSARTFSDDSVRTVKAAPLAECMATIEPRAVQTAGAGEPSKYPPGGGGGSFDWPFIVLLLAFAGFAMLQQKHIAEQDTTNREHLAEIAELEAELATCRPSDFCLRDIQNVELVDVPAGVTRRVIVKFTTYAGCSDFYSWLRRQVHAVNRDAEANARRGA